MDILIIGGTTYFGRDIVELALEAGHSVTVFSRGNQKPAFWNHIKHIKGDRHIQAEVTGKLKGLRFDVVVDNYVSGKIEAEEVLLEQDEVRYTIVRPSSIYGPDDPSGRCQFYLRRLLDSNPLILTNGGVHIHNLAYRRDVARGYIAAMSSEKAVNQVYNFVQNEMFRVLDWVSLAADLLEVKTDIVSISAEPYRDLYSRYVACPNRLRLPVHAGWNMAGHDHGVVSRAGRMEELP